jgi:hypothetical protein
MKTNNKYDTRMKLLGIVTATLLLIPIVAQTQPQLATAQENDTATRVAKNKQYLGEAQAAFEKIELEQNKIAEYQKQKNSSQNEQEKQDLEKKIQASLAEIDSFQKLIKELEQLNIKLFEVEPELKQRLYSAEKVFLDKYLDSSSISYVDDNPVELVFADLLRRSIVVMVNPDKMAAGGMPIEVTVDSVPVIIEYGKVEDVSCTPDSRTGVCRPLIGGVSVAEQNTLTLNTLGYKAYKGSLLGFVMAGHSAVGLDKVIVQPHNDATKSVGVVKEYRNGGINDGDFAWVRTYTGIGVDNQIYQGSGVSNFNIVGKTADSSQTVGSWVTKSGAATGNTLGQVTSNSPNNNYNLASNSISGGDSGSPIFSLTAGNANLYGMIAKQAGSYALYYPWDYINSQIGANPP